MIHLESAFSLLSLLVTCKLSCLSVSPIDHRSARQRQRLGIQPLPVTTARHARQLGHGENGGVNKEAVSGTYRYLANEGSADRPRIVNGLSSPPPLKRASAT